MAAAVRVRDAAIASAQRAAAADSAVARAELQARDGTLCSCLPACVLPLCCDIRRMSWAQLRAVGLRGRDEPDLWLEAGVCRRCAEPLYCCTATLYCYYTAELLRFTVPL